MSATPLQALSHDLAAIVARARPATVAIHAGRHSTTGFAWRPGLVVTAAEALPEDGDLTATLPTGERRAATRAGADLATDVALLHMADLPATDLPAAALLAAGAIVLANGGQDGAALGIVAATGPAWRSLRGGQIDARIDLDIRLRRSSEGAPVFDATGALVGMAVFGPRHRVLVIPTATIDRVAGELAAHGAVRRGYLGVGLHPVDLPGGGIGLMAMSIAASSPADTAGLKQGDILTSWNGTPITGLRSLMDGLGPDSIGRTAALAVSRAGAPLDLSITIAVRP